MRYTGTIILAIGVFFSTLVLAQDEKISPAEKITPVLPQAMGTSSKGPTETTPPVVSVDPGWASPNAGYEEGPLGVNAYQIGVGDVLDINVVKPIPITSRMTVTSDGTITFPYIGSVQARGHTLSQVQSEIQNRIGNYMDYPIVSVSLWEARSKKFTIYGQVIRPGAYPAEADMSLLRAISLAGGLSVPDATGVIKVLRQNKKTKSKSVIFDSDLTTVLNGKQDVLIEAGDTVVVTIDRFFIYGEVYHPGSYPLEAGMSLPNAITIAGGFAVNNAAGFIQSGSMGRVRLFRANPEADAVPVFESDINSILGSGRKISVHAGDTIVVSVDKFFVTGQVNRPGAYPVEEHMSLLDAISTAGGLTADASTGMIKLLRPKMDSASGPPLEVDVASVLNGTAPVVPIHASDNIVVTANNFYVYGEVSKPGMYSLESKTTALTAISIAGGFSRFGSASRVKVVRINEKTGGYETLKVNINEAVAGNSKADVMLMPGDIVVVSEGIF